MSLVRTNKQAYAILSDISGNSVTVSGSSLKVAVTDPLPTGTNSIGSINGVVPGTGVTQLGTVEGGDVSTTNVGVAALAIIDGDFDGLVDGSYTTLRTDASGAQWVHLISGTTIGVTDVMTVGSITSSVGIADLPSVTIGSTNFEKAYETAVTGTDSGVVGAAIKDDTLDGLADGSYTFIRTDASGAQWVHLAPGTSSIGTVTVGNTVTVTGSVTTNGSSGAVTVVARTYADGVIYDGSFSSEDDFCYDLSGGSQFSFAGRAQSGGADVSFVLAMYACSGPNHGTPDTATTAGDMLDTGYVLQNLGTGGPFFATFNDLGFPYVAFKNVTNEVTGNTADICVNLYVYRR